MDSGVHRITQIASGFLVLGMGRLLSAVGRSEQAMHLIGKHANSHHWKSQAFAGYEPGAHDVFVATFARSGTNWMMQIAQQIACYGSAEFEHIHDLVNVLGSQPILVPVLLKSLRRIHHEDALASRSVFLVQHDDAGRDAGAVEQVGR